MYASAFPMHTRDPAPKGAYAALAISEFARSPGVSQRVGSNLKERQQVTL